MTNELRPKGWENPYRMLGYADLTRFVAQITAGKVMDRGIQQALERAYEEGADAMMEAIKEMEDPIDIELDWRKVTTDVGNLNIPQPESFCKIPGCSSKIIAAHGYCREHYERLNAVT